MIRVRSTPAAEEDLTQCLAWLMGQGAESAAQRLLASMRQILPLPAANPRIGKARASGAFVGDVRLLPLPRRRRYLLDYRVNGGAVDILRVLDGRRDIARILGDQRRH